MRSSFKISVVSIAKNNKDGLARTLKSVQEQVIPCYEHIVIDGLSSDGTQAYLAAQSGKAKLQWISEQDDGIYDALNKGLIMASGDFVIFLNAGDVFAAPNVLGLIADELHDDDDVLYGNALLVDAGNCGYAVTQNCDHESLKHGNNLCHQAAFIRRELHLREPYDTRFRVIGDHDLFLRLLLKHRARFRKVGLCVCEYSMGGVSSDPGNRMRVERERLLLAWLHGIHPMTIRRLLGAALWLISIEARLALKRLIGRRQFDRAKRVWHRLYIHAVGDVPRAK